MESLRHPPLKRFCFLILKFLLSLHVFSACGSELNSCRYREMWGFFLIRIGCFSPNEIDFLSPTAKNIPYDSLFKQAGFLGIFL